MSHTPPWSLAAATNAAADSPTAPRPCGGAPLRAAPSGQGFQRAPCGPTQSAGSAPSTGPGSSPFPWRPGGKKERRTNWEWRRRRGGWLGKREMSDDKWREGRSQCTQRSSNNNDERERKNDREKDGEKHMQYQLLADRGNANTQLSDKGTMVRSVQGRLLLMYWLWLEFAKTLRQLRT